jgi:signal transduction histidine kinase
MHAEPRLDRSPLETGLSASMQALGATTGAILWREGESDPVGLVCSEGNVTGTAVEDGQISALPFLYDLKRHRALCRNAQRNLVSCKPASLIGGNLAAAFDLGEGLAIPVRSGTGEGQLFLQGVHLSTDHLDIGEQLGAELAGHIQRHELLEAAAESAAAQSRIALARDLHDSVVQFLAGAAFRLEAMRRSEGAGRRIEPELNELKQLMLQEQGELRAFITALRTGGRVAFTDLSRDLQSLTDRLSRQWAIECDFAAADADVMMSTDVHLDAHQLVREAVANAVRHAGAKSVRVGLSATRDAVRLEMVNDGAAYPKRGRHIDLPKSLRERVELAGGAIDLSRGMGVTKLSISLPVEGRRA